MWVVLEADRNWSAVCWLLKTGRSGKIASGLKCLFHFHLAGLRSFWKVPLMFKLAVQLRKVVKTLKPGERGSVVMAVFCLINFCLCLLSSSSRPDLSVTLGRRTHPPCFTRRSHRGLWLPVPTSCLHGRMFSGAALPSGLFTVLHIVWSWTVAFP